MKKEIIICCALAIGGIVMLWSSFLILVKKEKIGLSEFEPETEKDTPDRSILFKQTAVRASGRLFAAAGIMLLAAGVLCLILPAASKLIALVSLCIIFAVMAGTAIRIKMTDSV